MESDDFPNEENLASDSNPEVPTEVRDALREGVAAAIFDQRMAGTINDLVRTPWLMQSVVDKAMSFVEQTGVSLEGFEASVSKVITEELYELLSEEPDEEPDIGVREPREPILPSLLGGIALTVPSESAEAA